MGILTSRAHLGQYANGKYLMWLDQDDSYCSPDIAKKAYEKAEKTGTDIVHFKNLIDEPNGIRIQSGRSPKVSGIMKQPQLSDSLLNKRKNLTMDTFVLWDKLVSKATYLRAINFLGESRFKTYICGPEDQLLTFAIFNVAQRESCGSQDTAKTFIPTRQHKDKESNRDK